MRLALLFVALVALSIRQLASAANGRAPIADEPVIVVGGGLAGLSATISALENGAKKVILLEKQKDVGGNSAKASSGINA